MNPIHSYVIVDYSKNPNKTLPLKDSLKRDAVATVSLILAHTKFPLSSLFGKLNCVSYIYENFSLYFPQEKCYIIMSTISKFRAYNEILESYKLRLI